ncbi:MAG: sigma-54-dependent Fis family transcriptional regulator [Sedimentisphaerales bacterium]|nr:sigma-54-dependent Fis family transcriptional regulator [Sedimentisphaerales bacterium]
MKPEDIHLEEILDFSPGRIDLKGRRLVLHDIHAFAQMRKDLVEMVGIEQTRRLLTRFGFSWGYADAAAMTRIFKWDSLADWLKAGPRMHTLQGVTRSVVKSLDFDEDGENFNMHLDWHHSGEAEEHLIAFGKSDHCVCRMLVGYASGYATFCLGKNIYFIENKCRAKGDRICSATGKNENAWPDEFKDQLANFKEVDHIQKKIKDLTILLKRKDRQLANQNKRLGLLDHAKKHGFVEVHSRSFQRVLDLANRTARYDSSVLITGESGAGKEVLARYIHKLSARADNVFTAVNCGALPETLLESELFGHQAGSFTGAIKNRAGLFEQSQKGTIFLDEIGDITPALQLKLLRVLQEKEIMRVGESKTRKVDVRIIAATNKILSEEITKGSFREDLFYRLAVLEIEVPPLRDRKDDILPLARHFIQRLAKKLNLPDLHLDPSCLDYLLAHNWPGNVRELENALERAAVLSRNNLILPEFLPPAITRTQSLSSPADLSPNRTLAEVEKQYIGTVLKITGQNKSKAAKILDISPATLWRKLKKY